MNQFGLNAQGVPTFTQGGSEQPDGSTQEYCKLSQLILSPVVNSGSFTDVQGSSLDVLVYAATQDDTSISVRADIAVGVLVSWIGGTILAIVFLCWLWKRLRRGRRAARASVRAPERSRA